MKYLIQIFVTDDSGSVGRWDNTNWGGDDLDAIKLRAEQIATSCLRTGRFKKVRVLEVLLEQDCAAA